MRRSENYWILFLVLSIISLVGYINARPKTNRNYQSMKIHRRSVNVSSNNSNIYYDDSDRRANIDIVHDSSEVFDKFQLKKSTATEKTRILTHFNNPLNVPITEDLNTGHQNIIFPDSFETVEYDSFTRLDTVPQCAATVPGAIFCEDIPTYPFQHLREVLQRSGAIGHTDLFGEDETPAEISNRIGENQEMFICRAVEKTVYPKVGKTKNNKWKYIVNQDEDGYIQGVRVETCLGVNRPCDLMETLPNGYTTSCKQKFVYRRMLSISDHGQPVPDTFLMPSACCCSYKVDNPFLARIESVKVSG